MRNEKQNKLPNLNFWKGKKVFITGHTGFKGSWLTIWMQLLGAKVTGFSLNPDDQLNLFSELSKEPKFKNNFHHILGNINNLKKLSDEIINFKPDVIFHLAAQPLVIESYLSPIETWETNVMGTMKVLEALRNINYICSVVVVTTDKVYKNKEWEYGYRENDELGGKDPYSASKAAVELLVSSWRKSFCGNLSHQNNFLKIATARSGNVIGGGDWAKDRIIPDLVRSLASKKKLIIRNPNSTRPWQHVLDPLCGYIILAEKLLDGNFSTQEAFNFGPSVTSNRSVIELITGSLKFWQGDFIQDSIGQNFEEAKNLNLQTDKVFHSLNWRPNWDFDITIERTMLWYKNFYNGISSFECCLDDLLFYDQRLKNQIKSK